MNKRLLLLFILCMQHPSTLYSQWTGQDSTEIKDVFIRSEPPSLRGESQSWPSQYPITKDFSEYLKSIENKKNTDSLWIPPAVFIRLGLSDPLPKHQLSKTFYITGGKETVPRGPTFSADDALRYIFMPGERAKARNRKHANAWKTY
jgi:hypothetical protein